jgi:two-component system, cell cycle sensor histidine kinase and response regulator CckA
MKSSIHVVHIEDSVEDAELVSLMLLAAGLECKIQRVETREHLVEALMQSKCDLILSDCTLPHFHGLDALYVARGMKPEIPFIFVSGTIGEETAIKSLQNGATDYVLKQRLSRLVPAVRRALAEAEGRIARCTLEGQLRQARKLETIGTLVGGIAHDFRNLLQIQQLSIDLLPLVANEPNEVIRIAEQLAKSTNRGCDMMQELLVFARKTEANLAQIDIAAQIKDIAQVVQSCLPGNVSLFLDLEEGLPPILADGGQVDRMLTNLIVNARDAMPQGGNIVVSMDAVRFDQMLADTWHIKDSAYLRIRISDTGTGMDEETQSHVFEPFFTTKSEGKGTGLGLSVVFGLMESHQGFIDLQSQMNEGSTFSLFFPIPSEANVALEGIQTVSPVRLLGKTS